MEYEVEKILRHRKRRGRGSGLEYLVLWKGFDVSEATWERAENLANAPVPMKLYWDSVPHE